MTSVLTRPAASAVVVVHELGAASLTDIAKVTGSALSTVQRAVSGLEDAGVLTREWHRGPFAFSSNAPVAAIRQVADWTLGSVQAAEVARAARQAAIDSEAPATIRNPRIRRAWKPALQRLIAKHRPRRVILFGSQARGEAADDSDVDLLVVLDDVKDAGRARVQIRRTLADMPFAKDVVVATPRDLARPIGGTAVADAMLDGIVVYER